METMANSPSTPDSRFVADSQSPKVMFIRLTSFIADGTRSSRKLNLTTATVQAQVKDRFPFVGGDTPEKQARVLCMIQLMCSTIKPLQHIADTSKHYKGQSFCRVRPTELLIPLAKNCATEYLSRRSNGSNYSYHGLRIAYDPRIKRSNIYSVN